MYDNINLDKIVENYSLNCAWLDYTLKIYKKWASNHMHISFLMYSFIFFPGPANILNGNGANTPFILKHTIIIL